MKRILFIALGIVILAGAFAGGYYSHKPQTKIIKVPVVSYQIKTVTQQVPVITSPSIHLVCGGQSFPHAGLAGAQTTLPGTQDITLNCKDQ